MNDNQKVATSNVNNLTPNRLEPRVVELNMDDILPNRFQPRITFGEDAINELATSIKEHGVIQPIVVRKINDKFEIIAGERRYKASRIAGKRTIPAIITDLNDKESAEIALIENVQREDLTPIEEAVSYKKILDMGYLTQEELSSKLGKKQSTISNKLRLLNLDEEVQEALLEKKISERHARSLLKLNGKDQKSMLKKIIEQRLTVRKTDEEIEKILGKKTEKKEPVIKQPIKETKEEIELLDLEEKGDKNMNNDIYQGFNIPADPIIENGNSQGGMVQNTTIPAFQNQPQQPMQANGYPTPMAPTQNNANIAPGFMDVEKIATTASDINPERPSAPVEDLLKATTYEGPQAPIPMENNFAQQPQVTNPFNASVNNNDGQNKFFDMSNTQLDQTNMAPAGQPMAQPEVQNTNIFGNNGTPQNTNFVKNVEEQETNIDFGIPKTTFDNTNLNFDSFYENQPQNNTQPTMNMPQQQAPQMVPDFNIANEPIITPQPEVTPINTIEATSQMGFPQAPVPPMPAQPVQPVMPAGTVPNAVPQQPVMQPNYTVPTPAELDAYLNTVDSTTPMSNQMPANNVATPVIKVDKSKMDQVIGIMKDAKEKISALGIVVDLDEFDFDDMYQAIFKIDK